MSGRTLSAEDRVLLDRLFDKWTLLVLDELCDAPQRFNALRRALGPVTPKALSSCLQRLVADGIVQRRVLQTQPVAVEYRITEFGRTLETPMKGILDWVAGNTGRVRAVPPAASA